MRALEREPPQPLRGGRSVREVLRGIAIPQRIQVEAAALGDLQGAGDGARVVLEQRGEGMDALECMLGVGLNPAPGLGEPDALANAGQHVLQLASARRVIEHLVACDDRQPITRGPLSQARLAPRLVRTTMARRQGIEPIVEGLAQLMRDEEGVGLPAQQGGLPAPERDQVAGMGIDLAPADPAHALGATASAQGQQPTEIGVAVAALRQQDQGRAVLDRDLGPGDQRHAELARLHMGLDQAVDPVAIRQGQTGEPERGGGLHQLLGMTRPFEKRKMTLAPERDHPKPRPERHA